MSLYNKYRPTKLSQMVGCSQAKGILSQYTADTLPHTILFTGGTGCGKTTLARIVARGLLKVSKSAFTEYNASSDNGVDGIRRIIDGSHVAPLQGRCKMIHLDECHMLSANAQEALLKLLEEPPPHFYVALSTTDPQKLKPTLRNRCLVVNVTPASNKDLQTLVDRVVKAEGLTALTEDVMDKLLAASEKSPRQCLSLLETVANLQTIDQQLACLDVPQAHPGVFDLWKALLSKSWPKAAAALKSLDDQEPESIRWAILTMTKNKALKNTKSIDPMCYKIIVAMSEPFYNTKHAGLVAAALEVCGA